MYDTDPSGIEWIQSYVPSNMMIWQRVLFRQRLDVVISASHNGDHYTTEPMSTHDWCNVSRKGGQQHTHHNHTNCECLARHFAGTHNQQKSVYFLPYQISLSRTRTSTWIANVNGSARTLGTYIAKSIVVYHWCQFWLFDIVNYESSKKALFYH